MAETAATVATVETQGEKVVQEARPAAAMQVTAGFRSLAGFELLQRMARMFNSSSLVPEHFQGPQNFGNCAIALNMAQRLNADPLMVMQNLYVVYGNPGWSSKFMIAMFNQCGRYTSIKYKPTGKVGTDSQGIIAYATEKLTGETIEGPEVTIGIAKAEGWYGKNGSKWKTMPDQMLRYRAAAWLIRTTAPELSMGMQTEYEIIDVMPDSIEKAKSEVKANANKETFEPTTGTSPAALATFKLEAPKAAAKPAPAPKAEAAPIGPGF